MSLKAGLGGDIINFLIAVIVFFIIGYFTAYFMIGKFRFATPGRLGNYTSENENPENSSEINPEKIIELLGGRENIALVDACMTRLRVTVKNPELVADSEMWKNYGALGLVRKGNGIQAVYGTKADILKSDINDIL